MIFLVLRKEWPEYFFPVRSDLYSRRPNKEFSFIPGLSSFFFFLNPCCIPPDAPEFFTPGTPCSLGIVTAPTAANQIGRAHV